MDPQQKVTLPGPTLILGGGIMGSGKSTLYKELIPRVNDVCLINKDTINKAFLKTWRDGDEKLACYALSGEPISLKSEQYRRFNWTQSYDSMLGIARDNLVLGKHPLLEGNYTKEIRWGYLEQILFPFFDGTPHRLKILFCHAPEEVLKERLKGREGYRDTDSLREENWAKLMRDQPPYPPELKKYNHLALDTHNNSLEENVQRAIEYLVAD